jgi:hypothetical protein
MLKQRPLNIAETNMALFGTDLERKIKEESAKHEDAWKGAGQTPYEKVEFLKDLVFFSEQTCSDLC